MQDEQQHSSTDSYNSKRSRGLQGFAVMAVTAVCLVAPNWSGNLTGQAGGGDATGCGGEPSAMLGVEPGAMDLGASEEGLESDKPEMPNIQDVGSGDDERLGESTPSGANTFEACTCTASSGAVTGTMCQPDSSFAEQCLAKVKKGWFDEGCVELGNCCINSIDQNVQAMLTQGLDFALKDGNSCVCELNSGMLKGPSCNFDEDARQAGTCRSLAKLLKEAQLERENTGVSVCGLDQASDGDLSWLLYNQVNLRLEVD